ncbi:MAG: hypothetical protein ACYCY6_00285 [Minisyncoccota bacterium]
MFVHRSIKPSTKEVDLMSLPSEVRAPVKKNREALGSIFHPNIDHSIPHVYEKDGELHYASTGLVADDIDPKPIARVMNMMTHEKIIELTAAKKFESGWIILYTKKESSK